MPWSGYIGTAGKGMASGETYSDATCYDESFKPDPTDAMVWLSRGTAGDGMVSGEAYGKPHATRSR